jgi:hypothetical protein
VSTSPVLFSPVGSCFLRDIIAVAVAGRTQGFYRSSGRNSKREGCWLPFDGITLQIGYNAWFDKNQYCRGLEADARLFRYGTEELLAVSDALGDLEIPSLEVVSPSVVNARLGYEPCVARLTLPMINVHLERCAAEKLARHAGSAASLVW